MYSDARSTIHGMRIFIVFLLGLALLWPKSGESAAQVPILPQASVDTTYSPPSGNTFIVNAGGDLQAAIDKAVPGDTIVLQAGATFTAGTTFTLRNKTGSGWIYIQSSAYTNLPAPGTRVTPADAANMPKIVGTSSGVYAIQTDSQAHNYRFVGIEIRPAASNFVFNLVTIGGSEISLANLPHHIIFDRCYVHGDPSVGGRRGIGMHGNFIGVIDSYLSDFKESGADTQALWGNDGAGPFRIHNNYLEAAGENIMFGGQDPNITNLVPSDITITRNHFFKPPSWKGLAWDVKNLLEFKFGQRVLIEGNIFENNWASAQSGLSIVITPRNAGGSDPWSVTQDITFRLNKLINIGGGFNIYGDDDVAGHPTLLTRRVLIENNTFTLLNWDPNDNRTVFQIGRGPSDVAIRHNTAFVLPGAAGRSAYVLNAGTRLSDNFDFTDNIIDFSTYGFMGDFTNTAQATLNLHFTATYTFTKNAWIANLSTPTSTAYPAGNFFPASIAAVGFVNFAGGDYHLLVSSPYKGAGTDGKDLGADIDALTAAIAGASSLSPPRNLRVQ